MDKWSLGRVGLLGQRKGWFRRDYNELSNITISTPPIFSFTFSLFFVSSFLYNRNLIDLHNQDSDTYLHYIQNFAQIYGYLSKDRKKKRKETRSKTELNDSHKNKNINFSRDSNKQLMYV